MPEAHSDDEVGSPAAFTPRRPYPRRSVRPAFRSCGAGQRPAIKRQVRDAFYTDTPAWKQRIVEQGADAARRALRGLTG